MDDRETEMIWPENQEPVIPESTEKQPPNNMAAASMVLGILALIMCGCFYTVFPFGGLSILFAFLSRTEGRFRGQARIGIALSVAAMVLCVLFWIIIFVVISRSADSMPSQTLPMIPSAPDIPEEMNQILTIFRLV